MKIKLLTAIALLSLTCIADANARTEIVVAPTIISPAPVIAPTPVIIPQPVINQCQEEYNNIIQNEQYGLNNCNIMYMNNPAMNNACQQNVLQQTNLELYNVESCRDYYLSFGVIIVPNDHPHYHYRPHPEHFPHHEHREHYR